MKKRLWRIPVIVLAVIVFLAVLCIGILWYNGLTLSTGRYLEAKNGQDIFVLHNSPVVMSNNADRDIFKNFETGDKILVAHFCVAESYPGQTGVKFAFRLEKGTIEDVPETVVETLKRLEWLEEAQK